MNSVLETFACCLGETLNVFIGCFEKKNCFPPTECLTTCWYAFIQHFMIFYMKAPFNVISIKQAPMLWRLKASGKWVESVINLLMGASDVDSSIRELFHVWTTNAAQLVIKLEFFFSIFPLPCRGECKCESFHSQFNYHKCVHNKYDYCEL